MNPSTMAPAWKTFLTPIFRGTRFYKSVPLDVLPDLQAYRNLVVAVAREVFLRENAGRVRAPKRFEEKFQLEIRQIGEGSTVLPLERRMDVPDMTALFPPPVSDDDYFDKARDIIDSCIASVSEGKPPPAAFPQHLLPQFNNFGRNLKEDEVIELLLPGKTSGVRYNNQVRRHLVLAKDQSYEEDIALFGEIVAADIAAGTFKVRNLITDRTVPGALDPDLEDLVLDAFSHHRTTRVLMYGTARMTREREEIEFKTITGVDDLVPPETGSFLYERVQELQTLEAGWCDGEGEPFASDDVEWFLTFLVDVLGVYNLPRPHLYPRVESAIDVEWTVRKWELRATFDLRRHMASVSAVNSGDGRHELAEGVEWIDLGYFLERYVERDGVDEPASE